MAVEEAGGYDLARGFETMISGGKAIEQAIRDLQMALITTLSMRKDMSVDPQKMAQFTQAQNQVLNMSGAIDLSRLSASPTMSAQEISYRAGQTVGSDPGSANSRSVPAQSAPAQSGGGGESQPPRTSGTQEDPNAQGAQGGSGGGLVEGLIKAVPFSGFITKPLDEIRSQRDKNARYQSIVGGSNRDAFAERGHEAAYRMSTMGMYSAEEASKSFYGVTSLGYNNDSGDAYGDGYGRQEALDFIYKGKGARGQSVEEGLEQLDQFIKTPTANLDQFSQALTNVGNAAAAAGVNAKMAREMFLGVRDQATSAGFGMGSTSYAENVTSTLSGYGTAFAAQANTSGMTSQPQLRMQAAMGGTTYRDMILTEMKGGSAAAMGQKAGMQKLIGLFNPSVVKWVREQIAANPDMGETEVAELGRQMLAKSKMDPEQVKVTYEAFTGITGLPYEQVMTAIIRHMMGEGIGSKESMRTTGLIEEDDFDDLGQTISTSQTGGAYTGDVQVSIGTSETAQAYKDKVEATGGMDSTYRSGNFEQLLSRIAGEDHDAQEIKVNGKTMTLKEAAADAKAMAKIAQGKGKMVGGEFDGERVGTVTSQAEESAEEPAAEGTVEHVITLSDEAKRWFEENPGAKEVAAQEGNPP